MSLPLTAWPKHRVDLACTGKTNRAAGPQVTPAVKKTFDYSYYGRPAIGPDNVIYVCYYGSRLRAIRTTDWQVLWTYNPGAYYEVAGHEPTIRSDGVIYTALTYYHDSYQYVRALNPDGNLKWSHDVSQYTNATGDIPVPGISADGSRIYACSADALLLALDADTGEFVWWNWDVVGSTAEPHPPAVGADGVIYWLANPSAIGYLVAVNPDGTTKWLHGGGSLQLPGGNGPPVAGSNAVYACFLSDSVKLRAINPTNGDLLWEYPLPGLNISALALDEANQAIYVGTQQGTSPETLYAINLAGSLKWSRNVTGVYIGNPAVDKDGRIYVATRETGRVLAAFDPTGTELWRYSLPVNASDPVLDETGDIYLGTDSSGLYVFGAPITVPLISRPKHGIPLVFLAGAIAGD